MINHYYHLTRDQRCQIYALKTMGLSQRKIANHLNVSPSTICRELKRNQGRRGYRFQQADRLACERRFKASSRPKCLTPNNLQLIREKLREGWSPEQISGRLKLTQQLKISHESIYRYVWLDKKHGGCLYRQLRHGGKKYNHRSFSKSGRGCIPNRVDIQKRPKIVERKCRVGDWEGDTLIGAKHKGALLSYVDRKSKFVVLEKLKDRTAKSVVSATKKKLSKLPTHTITYDNGKEFSGHESIAKALRAKCFFAKPYRAWERALNEHTNGLVR